jgi:hypothetical protein
MTAGRLFDSAQTSLGSFDKTFRRILLPRGNEAHMATRMESTPRSNESRVNSHSQNAEAQSEIDSTAVVKTTKKYAEAFTDQQRREFIAVAAYYLAEGRNFEPGHETEDWLAAELQVGV